MPKVIEEKPYLTDQSKELFPKIDFADTFATTNHVNSLEEITKLVFDNPPSWIIGMMQLRNQFVKIVGIKTEIPKNYNDGLKVGDYMGYFKIYKVTDNEIIMGTDDSHLNFRGVINRTESDENNVKVTTVVKFNNTLGRIYMGLIKPFHRLILKRMVGQAFFDPRFVRSVF